MEPLEKIAAGSAFHFEKVERAVTAYRKILRTEAEENDPLTRYVWQILACADTGTPSGNALPARCGREDNGLDVNRFMEDVVQTLRRMVKHKVKLHVVAADRGVRVMADRGKMREVFAGIVACGSEIIRKGGSITLLARLLPIQSDLLEEGEGSCALLSVSSTDVAIERSNLARKNLRSAFRVIRSIIENYNGAIRIIRQRGKAQFNIYLPVMLGT